MHELKKKIFTDTTILYNHFSKTFAKFYFIFYLFLGILWISTVSGVVFHIYQTGFYKYAINSDFRAYYTMGKMLRHQKGAEFYNFPAQYEEQKRFIPELRTISKLNPFRSPPFVALLIFPFTFFSFLTAFKLWLIFELILFFLAYFLILKILQIKTFKGKLLTFFIFGTYTPVVANVILGQLSLLLLIFILLSYNEFQKEKFVLSGIFLSFLLLKPQYLPLLLLILFIRKYYRFIFGFFIGVFVWSALSVFIVGINGMISYFNYLFAMASWKDPYMVPRWEMFTWRGFISSMFLTQNNFLSNFFLILGIFLVLIIIFRFVIYQKETSKDFTEIFWVLGILGAIFISPYSFLHDLTLCVAAGVFLSRFIKKNIQKRLFLIVFLIVGYLVGLSNYFLPGRYYMRANVLFILGVILFLAFYFNSRRRSHTV